jgi:hypothetical protein
MASGMNIRLPCQAPPLETPIRTTECGFSVADYSTNVTPGDNRSNRLCISGNLALRALLIRTKRWQKINNWDQLRSSHLPELWG